VSEDARVGLHVGALLAVPAGAAWLSGLAFVFPSLGPTAFVLATVGERSRVTPRRVVGGHVVGLLSTPAAGAVIVAAVCGLYGVHRGVEGLLG
jgi:hypothetical protein